MIQKLSELSFRVEKTYYHGLAPMNNKILDDFPATYLTLSQLKKDFLKEMKSIAPIYKIRFLNRSENSLTLFFSSLKIKRSFSFKIYRPDNLSFDMFLNLIRPFLDLGKDSGYHKQAELKFTVMCKLEHFGIEINDEFLATRNEILHYIVETRDKVKHKLTKAGVFVYDKDDFQILSRGTENHSWREVHLKIYYDGATSPIHIRIGIFNPGVFDHKMMEKLFPENQIKNYLKTNHVLFLKKRAELKFNVERIINYAHVIFPFEILSDTSRNLTRKEIPEFIGQGNKEMFNLFHYGGNKIIYKLSDIKARYSASAQSNIIQVILEYKYKKLMEDGEHSVEINYYISAPEGVPISRLLPKKFLLPNF